MADLREVRLVLCFTENMSLLAWEKGGLFEREVALYRALRPHLRGITFVTYGDRRDLAFAGRLAGIDIVCNRWRLPPVWYRRSLFLPFGAWRRGSVVFKSNQIRGSDLPMRLAGRFNKPFICRCGYLFADNMKWREGPDAELTRAAMDLERSVFGAARRVVVTTPAMRETILSDYSIDPGNIRVIPNYVDTARFAPDPDRERPVRRLIFIGRLEREKNLFNLIAALAGLDVELWIVGDGSQRTALQQEAARLGVCIRFYGILPHARLPALLNAATLFILPSYWEGHPKTLLEALSCGLPCIGSDIPAIRCVIRHGENGLLCGLTAEAIRAAVAELLDNPALQGRLRDGARRYALAHLAIERVVEQELTTIREVIS